MHVTADQISFFFVYVILQQVDRPEDGGIPMHGLVTDHYQISGVPLVPIKLPLKLLRRGHLIGKLRDAPSVYSVHTRRKWCSMCLAHSLGIGYLHQGSYTVLWAQSTWEITCTCYIRSSNHTWEKFRIIFSLCPACL